MDGPNSKMEERLNSCRSKYPNNYFVEFRRKGDNMADDKKCIL